VLSYLYGSRVAADCSAANSKIGRSNETAGKNMRRNGVTRGRLRGACGGGEGAQQTTVGLDQLPFSRIVILCALIHFVSFVNFRTF
jgi:hypothetical protein